MTHLNSITGHTKTVALIGTPVEHSMSPAMHTASFEYLGLDYIYLAYNVRPEELEDAVRGLKALGFAGYNVTMPHKTFVGQYLDELSPAAELMGAVNTVVIKDGKTIGHNTDGAGFMRNVQENDLDIIGKKITVVGAGGAGSAIYTQAALDGVSEIDIYNTKDTFFDRAAKHIKEISDKTGCKMRLIDLADKDSLRLSVGESVLFVNATRVGMGDLENESVLSAEDMAEGLAVADTVYDPPITKLLRDADKKGLKTLPGLGMLLWQASIGEQIWTGKEMPTDFIEEKFF